MTVKSLYIIRGLPGSGKTTLAHLIALSYNTVGVHAVAHAADDFFTDPNGNYNYVREHIAKAHDWCQGQVDMEMRCDVPVIIVHNTFTRRFEISAYEDMSDEYGYTISEIICKASFKNVHDVPDGVIEMMRQRWEN